MSGVFPAADVCYIRYKFHLRASPSSQQLWSAGFICGRPCDMELVTRQSERSGHQQRLLQAFTEDIFIFSLLVYIAIRAFWTMHSKNLLTYLLSNVFFGKVLSGAVSCTPFKRVMPVIFVVVIILSCYYEDQWDCSVGI